MTWTRKRQAASEGNDAGGGEAKDENEGRHISNMMNDPHNGILIFFDALTRAP